MQFSVILCKSDHMHFIEIFGSLLESAYVGLTGIVLTLIQKSTGMVPPFLRLFSP